MSDAAPGPMGPSTQAGALLATLGAFVLILGVPAALYAFTGRTDVALGLVALFVAMVAVSAYALREVVKAQRREKE